MSSSCRPVAGCDRVSARVYCPVSTSGFGSLLAPAGELGQQGLGGSVHKHKTDVRRRLARVAVVVGVVAAPVHVPVAANHLEGTPLEDAYVAVPKAECGENDRAETDLQGRVPPLERATGFKGFDCNVDLIGQYRGQGAGIQLASYAHCAYYHTESAEGVAGVVAVDLSDPTQPRETAFLTESAASDPWESLKVHERRGLLAAVQSDGEGFAIYDVKQDCTTPRLLDDVNIPGAAGHAGNFAQDGRTYYGAAFNGPIYALDITDPTNVELILMFDPPAGGVHDLSTDASGRILYIADSGRVTGVRSAQNGLVIMDVSEIDKRVPNPTVTKLKDLYWDDGAIAQMTQLVHINRKPYMIMADENGSGGLQGWSQACGAGLPPFGFARIIDMSDPADPRIVSKLLLEVSEPEHCPIVIGDTAATAIFSYDSHYCSVDDPRDAKLLACSYFEAGLRVFDIRNPAAPVEVAYYNPPAGIGMPPGGASYIGAGAVQWNLSTPQIRLDYCQIWTTTTHSGLQVLQLTDQSWPDCPAPSSQAGMRRVAETTLSPLDPLIQAGGTVGVGAGSCVIRPSRQPSLSAD